MSTLPHLAFRRRGARHVPSPPGTGTGNCAPDGCSWPPTRRKPVDEDATVWSAFQQLQTYKAEIPSLFVFNAALIVSDGLEARIGTLTAVASGASRGALADPSLPQLQVLLEGVFTRRRLLALAASAARGS